MPKPSAGHYQAAMVAHAERAIPCCFLAGLLFVSSRHPCGAVQWDFQNAGWRNFHHARLCSRICVCSHDPFTRGTGLVPAPHRQHGTAAGSGSKPGPCRAARSPRTDAPQRLNRQGSPLRHACAQPPRQFGHQALVPSISLPHARPENLPLRNSRPIPAPPGNYCFRCACSPAAQG